jgi:hypothetical protein
MSAALKPARPPVDSSDSRSTAPATPPQQAPANPEAPPATEWAGDRIALAVWLTGALIVAALLLKDLFVALVAR